MEKEDKLYSMIPSLMKRIVEEYKPAKVILFGSYAYGEPTEDSDIDILVVNYNRLNPEEILKKEKMILKDIFHPVQLFCVSDEEFLETKDVIGGITFPASKYGKVLYEKS